VHALRLKYIYAYAGHDAEFDIAAFHPEARAISIGGLSSYPNELHSQAVFIKILSALAHEMGHDFLLRRMSPHELRKVSERFGGWGPIFTKNPTSLYSSVFFEPYPALAETQNSSSWVRKHNVASAYSLHNVHEWFAEAFAATIMNRLGEKNLFGHDWKSLFTHPPERQWDYWTNYNNVSADFTSWLNQKLVE
jgi:hypothetical protein